VNFWQSSIIGCTFAGPLTDVVFDGRMLNEAKPDPNPMRDVDLSGAIFDGVEFRGVTFDRVRLPSDPDLYLIRDPAVRGRSWRRWPPPRTSRAGSAGWFWRMNCASPGVAARSCSISATSARVGR
jgi:Pentapeptide repeats (8 copies)